jgi:hypothetical protein
MSAENRAILLEARVEELQTKVNQLTADNTLLRESLLATLGLAQEYAPKEMFQMILNSLIGDTMKVLMPENAS